ncbi:MAG: serine protease, partial [Sulfurimonadaceae bacterium]
DEREEVVILLKVLASEISRGDHNFALWTVDKINSKKYKDFNEFLEIIKNFKGEYLVLEDKEGVMIAIDRREAEEIEKSILERYSIKNSQRL